MSGNWSDTDRRKILAGTIRDYDVREVRGAEFRRLLSVAHTEGLLPELLRPFGYRDLREDASRHADDEGLSSEPEARSIQSPSSDRIDPRVASGWNSPESLSRLSSSARPFSESIVEVPQEIREMAEEIASDSDGVGIEPWRLELLLGRILYVDRRARAICDHA